MTGKSGTAPVQQLSAVQVCCFDAGCKATYLLVDPGQKNNTQAA